MKTPNWPKDNLGIPKVPDFIAKRFPFYENDIVLFYVPFINYPIETNDINKVFWGAMGKVAANLRHELKNYNKQGVFTREPKPKDNFLRVVIPQIERYTRNDGREVYRFDTSWWSGSYTVGVQLYPNIAYASVSYSQPIGHISSVVVCTGLLNGMENGELPEFIQEIKYMIIMKIIIVFLLLIPVIVFLRRLLLHLSLK